jgi:DMSO/TMAO reductase YedYZ molybdopterin-dependent catalytic subunit
MSAALEVETSSVHNERVAARLGLALGVAFTTCFVTGLYSHFAQHPTFGFELPSRPVGLYRVTQGLHVITGIASIPLLFAKLWSVYPKLFQWPPFESLTNLIERLAIFPLVAGSIFMLFTGLANINLWYPWRFNFPDTHYRTAWIVMGALAIHIGAKLSTTRRALKREPAELAPAPEVRADRRRFLFTAFGASALVAVFTVGQTFRPLARLALLAPRRPNVGPQGFPVNGTAKETGAAGLVHSSAYRLAVSGKVTKPLTFTLEELQALPQHTATLPITCVEGWSTSQRWTGVRVRDLLDMAGASPHGSASVESFQPYGSYRTSDLDHWQAHDPDTLLALQVNGEPLDPDHGYPLRLIAPNRPGVMQTKWIKTLSAT